MSLADGSKSNITGDWPMQTCRKRWLDQLCSGAKAGIEPVVHAMRELFQTDKSDKPDDCHLLLVDASNTFNSLGPHAALRNCRVIGPCLSRFLFNSYWGYAVIFLKGLLSGELFLFRSQEGTTQGCLLGILMYAIGVLSLVSRLKNPEL